jgi:hypothetical protein
VTVEVTYELNLEPTEDGEEDEQGWTAMVYCMRRVGVCGPFTETVPVPLPPGPLFRPVTEIAEAALVALKLDREFALGEVQAYGRFGKIALQVILVHKDQRHMVPTIAEGGGLVWVDAGPVRRS